MMMKTTPCFIFTFVLFICGSFGPINCFESCESYYDDNNVFHFETKCPYKCCGTCKERMCCYSPYSEKTLNQSNCEFDIPMSNLIVIFLLVLCMCVCCKRCCKRRINKQQTNPLGPVINHNERIVLIVPNSQNNSNIPNEPGTTQFLRNTVTNSEINYSTSMKPNALFQDGLAPPAYDTIFK